MLYEQIKGVSIVICVGVMLDPAHHLAFWPIKNSGRNNDAFAQW
jgi:hypothetical protein